MEYKEQIKLELETTLQKEDHKTNSNEFDSELLVFLAYLFYPKDVKKSYKFNTE